MIRRLACLLLVFGNGFAIARQATEGCTGLENLYSGEVQSSVRKTPLLKLKSLLALYDRITDDPTDCVTTSLLHRIAEIEKQLVVLKIDGEAVEPDWILPCSSVDIHNGACTGPELDTSASLPENNIATRLHRKLPRSKVATIEFGRGYEAKILGAFSDTGGGPVHLDLEKRTLEVGRLENISDHLVLILILQRKDRLRFRKVVWHLYPLGSAGH